MHLKMRNGNVAIQMTDNSTGQTAGGIFIPQTAHQGNLRTGKIIEVGPGELVQGQFIACDLEKDDDVVFDATRSEPLSVNGDTVWICNMVDVIAKIAKHLSVVPPENKSSVVPIK